MKFSPINKTLVPLLKKSLDAYSARHTAIAENIANVETTGFRPLKVNFEQDLQRALQKTKPLGLKTDARHMDIGKDIKSLQGTVEEVDARVNVEDQMAELAKNQIRFDFVSRMLAGSYRTIKTSIRGRLA